MTVEAETISDSPIMLGAAPDEAVAPTPDVQNPQPDPAPVTETQADPEPKSSEQPNWMQKRFDELTRKRYEAEERAKTEAEARAKIEEEARLLREMLNAGAEQPNRQERTYTQAELEAEANRIAKERADQQVAQQAEQAFNQRCNIVFEDGSKKFGTTFQTAVVNLNMAGVVTRGFVEAVLETDAPDAVLNQLGQNPDEALRLASLPPVRLGIELDRLATKLAAAPKGPAISNAPAPIAPVNGDRVRDGIDLNDPEADDAAWFAEMEKRDRLVS